MNKHILEAKDTFTEMTPSKRIVTLDGFVFDTILLENTHATPFADNTHIVAVIQFMGAKQKLIVSQLVRALLVVATESDMIKIFLLKLIELL